MPNQDDPVPAARADRFSARALRQQRKITAPRRAAKGGKRNNARRRVHRKRVFAGRHQVIAVISALGRVEGEEPGVLAAMRLGRQTLLEMVVERSARCAGGVVVLVGEEGVDAAVHLVGKHVRVCPVRDFNLDAVLAGVSGSQAPVVLVHEVAFPFAGPSLMNKLALAALDHGGAVCTGPGDLAVGEVSDGLVLAPVGSNHLQPIAMPQAFLRASLLSLHAAEGGNIPAAQVWQRLQRRGEWVQSVPNPRFNIRIKTSLDWLAARRVVWPWLQAKYQLAAGKPGMGPDTETAV